MASSACGNIGHPDKWVTVGQWIKCKDSQVDKEQQGDRDVGRCVPADPWRYLQSTREEHQQE